MEAMMSFPLIENGIRAGDQPITVDTPLEEAIAAQPLTPTVVASLQRYAVAVSKRRGRGLS